jgi:hypothetical protein
VRSVPVSRASPSKPGGLLFLPHIVDAMADLDGNGTTDIPFAVLGSTARPMMTPLACSFRQLTVSPLLS